MKFGHCALRRQANQRTFVDELHIDHADPHVLITSDIIDQAIFQPNEMLWMDFSNEQTCFDDHQHDNATCYRLRSVLHVKGVNREVLYRIGEHRKEGDVYEGHWPD